MMINALSRSSRRGGATRGCCRSDNPMTSIRRVDYAATPVAATMTRPASPPSPNRRASL